MKLGLLPLLALGITVLPASRCKIDPWGEDCTPKTTLTDTTKVGANTMSCLINGEVWVAQLCPNDPNLGADVKADWYPPNGGLTVSGARNVIADVQVLYIRLDSVFKEGVYPLGTKPSPGWIHYGENHLACYYDSDSVGTGGSVVITKQDRQNYIISGTFKATLYSTECADTIHVTQGRFDVRE